MAVHPPPFWDNQLDEFARRGNELLEVWPEGRLTSWWRSAAHNRRVGGARRSLHLEGLAIDVVVPTNLRADFLADVRFLNLHPLDEGDHVHVQWRPLRGG